MKVDAWRSGQHKTDNPIFGHKCYEFFDWPCTSSSIPTLANDLE